jgi:predicted kinase
MSMSKFQDMHHPTLVLIRGVPGSGKSYLATALGESLGKDKVLILDPDKIDLTSKEYLALSETLTNDGVDQKFHPYRWSRSKAYDAIIARKIIIWNQPFTNLDGFNKTVVNLQTYASEHGTQLPLLVVEVEVSPTIAKERVTTRKNSGGHGPSDNTFTRFTDEYRSFSDEGFNTVVVNGEDDVAASVAFVRKALEELGEK